MDILNIVDDSVFNKLAFRDDEWQQLVTLLPKASCATANHRFSIETSAYLLISDEGPSTRAEWIAAFETVIILTKRLRDALYLVADADEYDTDKIDRVTNEIFEIFGTHLQFYKRNKFNRRADNDRALAQLTSNLITL